MKETGENIFGPLYNEIGPGWYKLLDTLSDLIVWDMQFNNMPPVKITGIEERQRSLRIYYSGGNNNTDSYINFVRNISMKICEECGASKCDCTFWSYRGED